MRVRGGDLKVTTFDSGCGAFQKSVTGTSAVGSDPQSPHRLSVSIFTTSYFNGSRTRKVWFFG